MYMSEEIVGIAELRQNLSRHLRRVRAGHRIVVTDHNRPVATLGPPPGSESAVERLIAEGRLAAPLLTGALPPPVPLKGARSNVASKALEQMRADGF
jgi:prevent-host-death family protein